MENPGWYTPYTPYQAEIAQGRLESLLNFQTMVADLTGMEVANASLLDEATAAAEAMTLLHRVHKAPGQVANRGCSSSAIAAFRRRSTCCAPARSRSASSCRSGRWTRWSSRPASSACSCSIRTSAARCDDLAPFISRAHEQGVLVAVGTDLLALALLTPPGEMGADVVFGNSQRFGVPLGYGGPHAAFFATRNAFVRQMPGRIIGVSVDAHGHTAYRMALATREQHIRREKATSNICTAQALLANMAAMYAVYHGPAGLRAIAGRVHTLTRICWQRRSRRMFGVISATEPSSSTRLCCEVPDGADRRASAALERRNQLPLHRRVRPSASRSTKRRRSRTSATSFGCFGKSAGKPSASGPRRWSRRRSATPKTVVALAGAAANVPVPDASGLQHASLGNGDDALHPRRSSGRTSASTRR